MDGYNRAEQSSKKSKWTQCVTNKEVPWSREVKDQQKVMWGLKDEGDGTIGNKSISRNIFLYFLGTISPKIIIAVIICLAKISLLPPLNSLIEAKKMSWITTESATSFETDKLYSIA